MLDFFQGGAVPLAAWVAGVIVLGLVLLYGVSRAGNIRGRERAQLDRNTRARQNKDDPQK
jgi:hypothetical protein